MTATRQSPIDIVPSAVCIDPNVCKAHSINIDYKPGDCTDVMVTDSGFCVNVKKNCTTSFFADHLPGNYELAQFHAHWGKDAKEGSEHLLNGKALSGEVHFVFWNIKYQSFCDALNKSDGLAVLGVFLKEGKHNDSYTTLFDTVRKATGNPKPVALPQHFAIEDLLPAADQRDFVTYLGSLTTPPYSECVVWTVLTTPVEVSRQQLNVLRKICPANHRECQALCGRKVHATSSV